MIKTISPINLIEFLYGMVSLIYHLTSQEHATKKLDRTEELPWITNNRQQVSAQ